MSLKNKLVMAGVGVAAIVAAACSGGKEAMPVVTPTQGVGLTPTATVQEAPHDLTPEAYGLIPTSGSALVTDYLAKTELNVLELGAITRVLTEMQTVPAERISGNSWSYNYVLIGNINEANQGKLISIRPNNHNVTLVWKPGYLVVSYGEPPNPNDINARRVTLEEVANAAYGVGSDKVAAALGFEIDRKAPTLMPSLSTIYVAPK